MTSRHVAVCATPKHAASGVSPVHAANGVVLSPVYGALRRSRLGPPLTAGRAAESEPLSPVYGVSRGTGFSPVHASEVPFGRKGGSSPTPRSLVNEAPCFAGDRLPAVNGGPNTAAPKSPVNGTQKQASTSFSPPTIDRHRSLLRRKASLRRNASISVWFVPLLALAAGCDLPGKPDPADKFVYPNKVADFGALFAKNCAGCHGKDGKLGPAPPLNDMVFLAIVPDEELVKVITEGRAGTSMPAFADSLGGTLTAAQIRILAAGVRTYWKTPAPASKDWPPYVAKTKGDAKRGAVVFEKSCKGCHGDEGKGTAKVGAINDSAFLDLASDQMLRRIVITGRADLGMPNCIDRKDGALTPADVDDVTALLISWKNK
jgi:cytochrome c oxidase cbb3-type subunit III